jgi:hypothetical protein
MENKYVGGASPSQKDIRTFKYKTKGTLAPYIHKAGERYKADDITNQHAVGICTGISQTQLANKAENTKYSADFQYFCQKKYFDGNWEEGSSIFNSLRVAKGIGLLPESEWTWTTEEDRKLPYSQYIEKLKAIPDSEIARLILIANKHRIKAYARLSDVSRDTLMNAIADSKSGILARFVIGKEWWTEPIEPLQPPVIPLGGHAVILSNGVGRSFCDPNTWGSDWASDGSAYFLITQYQPTEAWSVWYNDEEIPEEIEKQLESRSTIIGKIMDLLQQIISLVIKLK